MPGPLSGFKILDLTTMISGPIATRVLADQGADVIKLEAPGTGDLVRSMGPSRDGLTATFVTSNRNKRSLVVDLKQPQGLVVLHRLIAQCDAFVQNFRPGAAERLGIGEDALRAQRPDLVYVSISGFGESGPYAGKRVYDPVVQALSGLAAIQEDRDTGRPRMMRLIVPDKVTALAAAQSITAALLARERTGRGQHLRLAMLDAVIEFLWPEAMAGLTFVDGDPRQERARFAQDLVFETADGFITAGTVTDAEWEGLVRALEAPEWTRDARFHTAAGRVAHAEERLELMADTFRHRTSAEWLALLEAEDVPCAPVLRRTDLLTHPQIEANELIVETEHPRAGRVRQPRPAARFDGTPTGLRLPAPSLGEHTDQILGEIGLDPGEIAALRAAQIVA